MNMYIYFFFVIHIFIYLSIVYYTYYKYIYILYYIYISEDVLTRPGTSLAFLSISTSPDLKP